MLHAFARPFSRLVPIAGLAVSMFAAPASADLVGYLSLNVNGTTIQGGVTAAGHEGWIQVNALTQVGFSPVAPNGAVGTPQHRPITLMKPVDEASPLLWKAWATKEPVVEAVIEFWRPTQAGSQELYYTIVLGGGAVSGMAMNSPDSLDPAVSNRPATELVSFTYNTITWAYARGPVFNGTWGGK